jgi:hypothetical protein
MVRPRTRKGGAVPSQKQLSVVIHYEDGEI